MFFVRWAFSTVMSEGGYEVCNTDGRIVLGTRDAGKAVRIAAQLNSSGSGIVTGLF